MKKKLSIVGIRGIPNNYGGFETLVEYLAEYLSPDFDVTVYCSAKDMKSTLREYKGAKLEYVNISSHGGQGIIYDSICLLKAARTADRIIFLGFGAGFVIPLLSKKSKNKIILNIGGLDWKRNKWSPFAQKIIKKAELLLVRNCGQIVSDNIGIQQYIFNTYKRESVLIAYGGDQASYRPVTEALAGKYPFLKNKYAFAVTRIQPDNNIAMILEAALQQDALPLVMVGNWDNSLFGINLKKSYAGQSKLILLDAIYDPEILNVLRSNCAIYIHGHSAGGTNPSLVEAMHLSLPVFAFASGYNEYTTENKATYFKNEQELATLMNTFDKMDLKKIGNDLKLIAEQKYKWDSVINAYKQLIQN